MKSSVVTLYKEIHFPVKKLFFVKNLMLIVQNVKVFSLFSK